MVPHTQCQKDAEDDATSTTRVTTATTTTNIKMEKMETGLEKKIQKQGEDDGALSPYPFPVPPCPGVFRPCARASSRSSVLCSFSQNHILSLFFLIQNRAEISKRFAQGCRYTRWQRKFPVNDPAMVQQARVRESWAFLSAARHVSYIVICICADWQNGKNQRNTQTDLRKLRRFASHIARTLAISWHCSLVIGFVRGHLFSLTYIPI